VWKMPEHNDHAGARCSTSGRPVQMSKVTSGPLGPRIVCPECCDTKYLSERMKAGAESTAPATLTPPAPSVKS
jgi:hypothetical protein